MSIPFTLVPVVVAVGLAAVEWARPDHAHRLRRVAASLIAVGSLAMLWPRIGSRREGTATAVLVTAGADAGMVRHIADSAHAATYVLSSAADSGRLGAGTIVVPDVPFLIERFPATAHVIVAGWGLGQADLDALQPVSVTFFPAAIPNGFGSINWPRALSLGSRLTVRGTAIAPPGARVFLDGPSGTIDSATVAGDSTFTLTDRPRAAARLRYALRLVRAGTTIVAETLGVSVERRVPPRLLVLDGTPQFETRYLKDWIGREGGVMAVRTEISRNRYRSVNVNRPNRSLSPVTASLLGEFDVVLLDETAAAELSGGEREAILSSVRERGLGLVLRSAGSTPAALSALFSGMTLRAMRSAPHASRLIWGDHGRSRAVLVAPYALTASGAAQPLIRDSAGAVVAAWRPVGAGAVAMTLVSAPSQWQLSGDREHFAGYWSLMLGRVARSTGERWSLADAGPPAVDQPMQIRRSGAGTSPSATIIAPDGRRDSIFLAQDLIDPSAWGVTYWPRLAGWHRIVGDSAELDFDARPSDQWRALSATARRNHTRQRFAAADEPSAGGRGRRFPWRIPPLAYFLLFVGSAAVLWMERR